MDKLNYIFVVLNCLGCVLVATPTKGIVVPYSYITSVFSKSLDYALCSSYTPVILFYTLRIYNNRIGKISIGCFRYRLIGFDTTEKSLIVYNSSCHSMLILYREVSSKTMFPYDKVFKFKEGRR